MKWEGARARRRHGIWQNTAYLKTFLQLYQSSVHGWSISCPNRSYRFVVPADIYSQCPRCDIVDLTASTRRLARRRRYNMLCSGGLQLDLGQECSQRTDLQVMKLENKEHLCFQGMDCPDSSRFTSISLPIAYPSDTYNPNIDARRVSISRELDAHIWSWRLDPHSAFRTDEPPWR
jgi:hypothetical protein